MAIEEFWGNLRNAISQSATTTSWLSPWSVDEFDLNDFRFLDQDQQQALKESVEQFLDVAHQIPDKQSATETQIETGRKAFEKIVQLLRPDRYWDAESLRTEVLLNRELRAKVPGWVTAISCETGTDSVGDPALWVWLDVTDKAVDQGKIEKNWRPLHDAVEAAYRNIRGRRWLYIHFRSPDAFARKEGGAA